MTVLTLGSLHVDLSDGHVVRDGVVIPLAPKEAAILSFLAARPNQDVSRDELYRRVWGYDAGVVTRTLDTTVHRLRTKIEIYPSDPAFLRTVHGHGYRLVLGTPDHQERSLVGREAEVDWILGQQGAVLITGPMGIGKTALAHALGDREASTTWLDATDRSDDAIANDLASQRGNLVIVDNLDGVGPQTGRVARRHGSRVVLCSRSTLRWRGPTLHLSPLSPSDSAVLLRACLPPSIDPLPPSSLHRLGSCAEGVPALLVALADALPVVGPATLEDRLCDPTSFRDVCPCAALAPRLAPAWMRLAKPQQELLLTTAWLGDEVELQLLEAVHEVGTAGVLTELYQRGWLAPAHNDGKIRVYRHIRSIVLGLASPEILGAIADRVARVTATWAARPRPRYASDDGMAGPMTDAFRRVYQDRGALDERWRLAFDTLLRAFGTTREHLSFVDECLRAPTSSEGARAAWLLSRAELGVHHRRPTVLEDTASILSSSVSPETAARAWSVRAVFHQQGGDSAGATEALEGLADLTEKHPELGGLLDLARGQVFYCRGDLESARTALREASGKELAVGRATTARSALVKLAVVLSDELDLAAASATLEHATLLRVPTSPRDRAASSLLEARIAMLRGDLATSQRVHRACSRLAQHYELHGAQALCETALVWLCLAQGDIDDALQHAVQSLDLWGRHRNPMWLGSANTAMAAVHLLSDEPGVAEALLRIAVQHLATDKRHETMARCLLAYALMREGRHDDAAAELTQAAEWSNRNDDRLSAASVRAFRRVTTEGGCRFDELPEPYRSTFRRLPGS
mgnify:CR=1 FL=1